MPTLLVALGGAVGAVLRYRIGVAVGVRAFPWATLAINIVGAFVLVAYLAGPLAERWSPASTAGLAAGLLGGFTTFSTFGFETIELVRAQRYGAAAAYVAATMVLGVGAAAAGYAAGRAL